MRVLKVMPIFFYQEENKDTMFFIDSIIDYMYEKGFIKGKESAIEYFIPHHIFLSELDCFRTLIDYFPNCIGEIEVLRCLKSVKDGTRISDIEKEFEDKDYDFGENKFDGEIDGCKITLVHKDWIRTQIRWIHRISESQKVPIENFKFFVVVIDKVYE